MIKHQREIFIINECSAIFDKEELKQAILWKTKLPVLSTKRVFMYGNYPAISIYDKKIHIHRLLMEYWLNARIPKEFAVHHLNENKLDARKENLAVILHSVHISSHNKGKKPAESTIKATIESNKRRRGTHYKNIHENPDLLGGGRMSLDQAIKHGKEKRKNITVRKPAMRGVETMVIVGYAEEIAFTSEWSNYYK